MSELAKIYEQVYEKICNERENAIFTQEKGALYTIILELVDEYNPQQQRPRSKMIFDRIAEIKSSNTINDDYKVIESLINAILIDRKIGVKSLENAVVEKVFDGSNRENQMKWLIIAGCMIVGACICIEYIRRRKNAAVYSLQNNEGEVENIPPPSPPIPAALCLVVPASIASNFSGKINASQVRQLIDNASYFSCKRSSEADVREQNKLKITNEILPADSQREVYMRMEIKDGKSMIDRTTRFELKENLKDSIEYEIAQKACLASLSGLDSFVRI